MKYTVEGSLCFQSGIDCLWVCNKTQLQLLSRALMSVIPGCRSRRQEDQLLKVILGNVGNSIQIQPGLHEALSQSQYDGSTGKVNTIKA